MKFLISSAKGELYAYRRAAWKALLGIGATVVRLDAKWGLRPRQLPDAAIVAGVIQDIQQCDALVAILGRDKGLRTTKRDIGLVEYEIMTAENAGILVFSYVTPNSRLFVRLEKSRETQQDIRLLSQSEVVKQVRSSEDLASELLNDVESHFLRGIRDRHAFHVETVSPIHWPTLAAHPEELLRCSPRFFEEVVAELLRADGWDVDLVVSSNAPGPDIIACSSHIIDTVPIRMIVECKRLRQDRPIDIDVVRKIVYWVNEEYGATLGMIATTSRFTREARQLVETKHRWRIALRDQEAIVEWINRQVYRGPTEC